MNQVNFEFYIVFFKKKINCNFRVIKYTFHFFSIVF